MSPAFALVALTAGSIPTIWFALPLALAMSCVYSASRYESWPRIVAQSARWFVMILVLLVVAMGVLLLINTQV